MLGGHAQGSAGRLQFRTTASWLKSRYSEKKLCQSVAFVVVTIDWGAFGVPCHG